VAAAPDPQHVFFYGTLMRPFATQARLGVEGWLQFVAPAQVRGALYDLGRYPGLVAGQRLVRGQLFRILDGRALAVLDRFEAYDPDDPAGSEYLRVLAALADRPQTAWVYRFNRGVAGLPLIQCDDWAQYAAGRGGHDFEGFFRGRWQE